MSDVTVTFACYNQVSYTQACLDSMIEAGDDLGRVVVVDNSSRDETRAVLTRYPLAAVISNKQNLGCGVAWNQGILQRQTEWTIIMNNDVLVSPGWLEGLVFGAEKNHFKIASPAMIEGDNDYGFGNCWQGFYDKTNALTRPNLKHAVCLLVHQTVFEEIGYFSANPRLLGFEDTLFFAAANKAGIKAGIVGQSWIHHFGSITQKAMKEERGLSNKDGLGAPGNKYLLGESWLQRKLSKHRRRELEKHYREQELKAVQMTLHGLREQGAFRWI